MRRNSRQSHDKLLAELSGSVTPAEAGVQAALLDSG
jgi:hypothetical protein